MVELLHRLVDQLGLVRGPRCLRGRGGPRGRKLAAPGDQPGAQRARPRRHRTHPEGAAVAGVPRQRLGVAGRGRRAAGAARPREAAAVRAQEGEEAGPLALGGVGPRDRAHGGREGALPLQRACILGLQHLVDARDKLFQGVLQVFRDHGLRLQLLLQLLLLLLLARSARRGCPGRHRQHRRFHLHGGQRFLSCPEVCEAPLGGGDSLLQAALGGPPRCGLPADLLRKDFRACRDDLHEPQHLAELPDDGGASHVLRPPILRPHRGALPPDLRREALQLPAEISVDLAATCLDVAPELCTGGGHFSAEARGRCVYPGPELAPQLCSQAPHLGA
mmetsp:Transcript_26113/g.82864  ORF Transcript_26113/g.82864 Transcript_26113/m.82864 type:complete len:333 (-) Transcript_26113:2670-3668(-)